MHSQRSGPEPLPDDSWDSAGTGLQRHIRRSPRRYRWFVLILAVTAAVPAVLVPLLSSDDQPDRRSDATFGSSNSPSSSATAPSSTPSSTAVAVAVTAPPPPAALVIEAEAPGVHLRGAAAVEVADAFGGRAVRFTNRNGEVQFRSLALPGTGSYRVTIVYAPGDAWSASVRGSNDTERVNFAEGGGCCRSVAVTLRLSDGGSLTIELSRGRGSFPAIDRVVIEDV